METAKNLEIVGPVGADPLLWEKPMPMSVPATRPKQTLSLSKLLGSLPNCYSYRNLRACLPDIKVVAKSQRRSPSLPKVSGTFYTHATPFLMRDLPMWTFEEHPYRGLLPDKICQVAAFSKTRWGSFQWFVNCGWSSTTRLRFTYIASLVISRGKSSHVQKSSSSASIIFLLTDFGFWFKFGNLPRRQKLAIDTDLCVVNPKTLFDARASPYCDLLGIVEKCPDLEKFDLITFQLPHKKTAAFTSSRLGL